MAESCVEPLLSRIHRLDYMLKQLEEIRGGASGDGYVRHGSFTKSSMSTSEPSTPSSGTDGGASLSNDFSPRSLQKHCRPIDSVIMEAESKGTLIERLDHVEERLLKLCMRMEEELDAVRQKEDHQIRIIENTDEKAPRKKSKKKKGLKQIVKKLVGGGGGGGNPDHSSPL
ncbi:uncharacterized protein LOC116196498 [Punica granatum]|uniref:Uncharacterized protein n=2 Tax=Punica granatum TaxID=22663 RepID=A0A218WZP8_PUNGR|nr:uncharacterized protein LOC116196498 [Punica granatum]OWM78375.1 hypothetical protein CDL15_Pgr016099 [Punica granatum]PKI31670.1 hypothetical protein CRG98_047954 [Punica granatum]